MPAFPEGDWDRGADPQAPQRPTAHASSRPARPAARHALFHSRPALPRFHQRRSRARATHAEAVLDDVDALEIEPGLAIPRSELRYRASRAGGPGGQHVNTSSTRVELLWDVAASPSLSEQRRARLLEQLANRIDARGVLRLVESRSRSQHRNRERVTERFQTLVARALAVPTPRKKTRPGRAAREARLREKKRRAEIKRRRGPVEPEE